MAVIERFESERQPHETERTGSPAAGVRYRWHDLRHTFISCLAERPEISEQTIMSLAGHVSRSMLARYSHIRNQAKQSAIEALERGASAAVLAEEPPQKSPQLDRRRKATSQL